MNDTKGRLHVFQDEIDEMDSWVEGGLVGLAERLVAEDRMDEVDSDE